jgi:hypothetical protein
LRCSAAKIPPSIPPAPGPHCITPPRTGVITLGFEKDVIALVKAEGFKINETIRDALDEFIGIVSDENETMQEGSDTEKKLTTDEEA